MKQGKKKIFLPLSLSSLPSKIHGLPFKKTPPTPLAKEKLSTCWRDGGGEVAQWPPEPCLSLVFAYKNRGGEEKKRDRREREEGIEKKKTEREEKRGRRLKKKKK
jgi:hypothetical protein